MKSGDHTSRVCGWLAGTRRKAGTDGTRGSRAHRGGRRRYSPEDLDWLQLLTCLRGTGMPVREMRRYAELARSGPATVAERLRLFEEHRERVLARIADLQRDLDAINAKIGIYRRMESCDAP